MSDRMEGEIILTGIEECQFVFHSTANVNFADPAFTVFRSLLERQVLAVFSDAERDAVNRILFAPIAERRESDIHSSVQ